jgi:hypothetical protein
MHTRDKERVDDFPVIPDIKDFDRSTGILLERIIFNFRHVIIVACVIVTIVMGFQASKLVLNAGFEKMLPQKHPYIKNYLDNQRKVRGLGNALRIAVATTEGNIFDPQYLEYLKQINDEVFLTPGVDRSWLKSLWTPRVRWLVATEEGFEGGPVIPSDYDGSVESIEQIKLNVARADITGFLVAENLKSSVIVAMLLDKDFTTGDRLDYSTFSRNIENIRTKYESISNGKITLHITGFAKIVGDLIEGLRQIVYFFIAAVIIAVIIIYFYTRCLRSTALLIFCSLMAVIWQLGAISALGFELDPYAILVPFLVFAIAVSHGMQKMNGIMQDIGRGTHKLVAARYTFRRLFTPGLTALLTDAIGFSVLMLIDIPVIRDLVLTCSVGVLCIIFTNLMLLPVFLSYAGVSPKAAIRSLKDEAGQGTGGGIGRLWSFLTLLTSKRWAVGVLAVMGVLFIISFGYSLNVKIGDLDPGAPELRPDSRYNRDNAFINSNYGLSSDQFAVIVKTPREGCLKYETLIEADRLARVLREVPGVQSVVGVPDAARLIISGNAEGSPKWYTLSRNQYILNQACSRAIELNPDLFSSDASIMPMIAYLTDHKAETLERVVNAASDFSKEHSTDERQFLLAAGNSGIEAATNIVVKQSHRTMSLYLYAAMIVLCYITFRSWRAVLVALIPLLLTTLLCETLMVFLGIGMKVATLPVIALGVGVGVDYALYLVSVMVTHMRAGLPLEHAYRRALGFTGKVVALIGITLAGAVITWGLSPIKFQADMGILLSFMFFYNMIGALVFIPALSCFLIEGKIRVAESTAVKPTQP